MIFNIMIFIVASMYWFYSGHVIPAFLGYAFLLIYIYDDELYFTAYAAGILALISVIYFFYSDYVSFESGNDALEFGMGIIYMLVILMKSKSIFDNDKVSLD